MNTNSCKVQSSFRISHDEFHEYLGKKILPSKLAKQLLELNPKAQYVMDGEIQVKMEFIYGNYYLEKVN